MPLNLEKLAGFNSGDLAKLNRDLQRIQDWIKAHPVDVTTPATTTKSPDDERNLDILLSSPVPTMPLFSWDASGDGLVPTGSWEKGYGVVTGTEVLYLVGTPDAYVAYLVSSTGNNTGNNGVWFDRAASPFMDMSGGTITIEEKLNVISGANVDQMQGGFAFCFADAALTGQYKKLAGQVLMNPTGIEAYGDIFAFFERNEAPHYLYTSPFGEHTLKLTIEKKGTTYTSTVYVDDVVVVMTTKTITTGWIAHNWNLRLYAGMIPYPPNGSFYLHQKQYYIHVYQGDAPLWSDLVKYNKDIHRLGVLGTGSGIINELLTNKSEWSYATGYFAELTRLNVKGTLDVTGLVTMASAATGLVVGLNADLLDGIEGTGYAATGDVSDLKTDVDGFPDELKNLVTVEIQQLENISATTISEAQWAILGGLAATLTDTELNYVDGVTTGIQGQLDGKEPTIGTGTTGQYWRGDKTWQAVSAEESDPIWGGVSGNYSLTGHAHNGVYEPAFATGATGAYFRGDKAWATLNQAAVAGLTTADSPTLAGLTVTGLTASLPVVTDANKALASLAYTGATSLRKNLGLETDDSPTFNGLNVSTFNLLPTGMIMMWHSTVATIPTGWVLCDGYNSTPDLRDKFVVGAKQDDIGVAKTNITGALTQSGGSVTIGANNLPTHTHPVSITSGGESAHTHGVHINSGNTSANHTHNIDPPNTTSSTETTNTGTSIFYQSGSSNGNLVAGSAVGVQTGSHSHTTDIPSFTSSTMSAEHYHNINGTSAAGGNHTHDVSGTSAVNSTTASAYTQPFYALVYIMKI